MKESSYTLIRFLWPALLWTLFILILTLIPGKTLPSVDLFQVDKVVHIFLFSVLMILLLYNLQQVKDNRGLITNVVFIAFVYNISVGIIIEGLQLFVPGRNFSWIDLLANSMGAALGYLFILIMKSMRKK